ncbi:hypothetical protein PPL_12571 [Heterostelium album PN500]|uniref:B box-type domain-containing protein n=1 Tax=Heterostelium pallidum (strain ATCC 26659 / Pp 5 / PN500) TaxID=670386 RepID=D3BMZ7_HETP5|nr:hypothetical protein PPL_12571 [Heterostelium album PN500]EFA77359.1 hypothetical protein PPL_12571 [Heterostelium album PN500]|eukprot:XP_020429488.1 hypothetical protein PPL_12571 [Heterostelium album PN500]
MDTISTDIDSSVVVDQNGCEKHAKRFKFFCFQCNLLICPRCLTQHQAEYRDHQCEHLDNIKDALLKLDVFNIADNNSNNNNNNNVFSNNNNTNSISNNIDNKVSNSNEYLIKRLLYIWQRLKSSTVAAQSLENKIGEISYHYSQIFEYLMTQELKSKKPLQSQLETVELTIQKDLKDLSSLIELIDHSKYLNQFVNNSNNSNSLSTSSTSSSTSSISPSEIFDTTDKYQLENIIKSVNNSQSLSKFITTHRNTLFNNNINYLDNQENNIKFINQKILDLFINYTKNSNIDINDNSCNNNNDRYNNSQVIFNRNDLEEFKSYINKISSINLIDKRLKTFMFITNRDKSYSLLNLDENVIQTVHCDTFDFIRTVNSMVTVGPHIYIFSSYSEDYQNKYCRFNVETMSIDHCAAIENIEIGRTASVCYDGVSDYIYLINGYNDVKKQHYNRVDRFNWKTLTFEKYYEEPRQHKINYLRILSFFFKGLIYSVPVVGKSLHIFDPADKTMKEFQSNHFFERSYAACTDGNGMIYILSTDGSFQRLSVETKVFAKLSSPMETNSYISMVYHQNKIYLFSNEILIYSIEHDRWGPAFLKLTDQTANDFSKIVRTTCGASLFQKL